jgi:3-methyladenine DNA glycosylase AlkD
MNAADIVQELKTMGTDGYKRILMNHGVQEPIFGVKIEHMKVKFQKKIKKDYQLALDLYETGIYDAKYLAGLIADESQMTKKDLQKWLDGANGATFCEYTVPWVTAESAHGRELALKWIDSKKESVASAGWATLAGLTMIKDDADLNLAELKQLLQRVEKTIHEQPGRVKYTMNNFVISVGSYVKPLSDIAMQAAKKVGRVTIDMGDTDCKVPYAPDYIDKVKARGTIGKKRKTCRC